MEGRGIPIAFEKLVLLTVLFLIWMGVILMEKLMPHQSAALLLLVLIMVYGLLIGAANYHHRRKVAKGMAAAPEAPGFRPSVSIVIPAHNEATVIADTVRAMMQTDYDRFDLWVFDDRSTDGTRDVLASLAQEFPERFYYVVRPETATPGKSAVLNDALATVSGEIIAVFDADGRAQPDFLTRLLPYLADPGVGAVQMRKVIQNAGVNLLTRCQANEYLLDGHFQAGRDVIRGAVELRGNGQLVKRQALQSVGGWNEDTITDDLDLSTQLHLAGWDIRFVSDVTVEEEGIIHFKPLLRQRRRWAEGSLKRYLEHVRDILLSPHISHRAQMDTLAYFLQFLFPLWVVVDCLVQAINLVVRDTPTHLLNSVIVFLAISIFFLMGTYTAIRHYERRPRLVSLWLAIETAVFLMVVWVPVVLWITAKVLMARDDAPLNWGKTEHLGTQVAVRQSRLAKLKSLIQRSSGTPS